MGGELVRQASEAGWRVVATTRSGESGTVALDLSDRESVRQVAGQIEEPSVIVHCASSGRGGEEAYRAVFEEGVEKILESFPHVPLIFVSSSSVYAQVDGEHVTEESEASPTRETGRILRRAEALVSRAGGTVARLAGIYGPGRSVLLKRLLTGQAEIEEDGRRIINQIHQYDAASALLFLAEQQLEGQSKGETYNVSDSHPRSQKQTYVGLCSLLELPLPPVGKRDLNRKRGWTHKAVQNGKLCEAGWEPQYADFLDAALEVVKTLDY